MARDYADVSPLKGTYSGGAASAIEVSVDVTRLRDPATSGGMEDGV